MMDADESAPQKNKDFSRIDPSKRRYALVR
jgi:hypothetical protein